MNRMRLSLLIVAYLMLGGIFRVPSIRHNRRATSGSTFENGGSVNTLIGYPTYSVSSTGSASSGLGPWGIGSKGAGYSAATPAGQLTTTSGLNECFDYAKHAGGGVVEIAGPLSFAGQVIFRNTVTVRGNNLPLTNTTSGTTLNCPFLSDVDAQINEKSDLLQMQLLTNNSARNDVIINAAGATTIGASPYTYTNATAYYQVIAVIGGTVSQIQINGVTGADHFGIFAVQPGGTVNITYTAGAGTTPAVAALGSGLIMGSAIGNNYDLSVGGDAGNGITICGWTNSAGTYLNNNASNHYLTTTVGAVGGVGVGVGNYGVRCLGAGPANRYACVNNKFDLIYVDAYGANSGTACYGLAFSNNTDSNFVGQYYPVSSTLCGGGAALVFNDLLFLGTAATSGVNNNRVDNMLMQCTLGTTYGVLTNGGGVLTVGPNEVTNLFGGSSGLRIVIQNGGILSVCDVAKQNDYRFGQNNFIGVAPSVVSTSNAAAATASTTLVAAGFAVAFTPKLTGIIKVTMVGSGFTNTAATFFEIVLYIGTTALSNGNALSGGVQVGSPKKVTMSALTLRGTFALCGRYVATAGTTYYIDAGYETGNAADTAQLENVDIVIEELPA